jgi:hypothetical protein
MTEQIRYRPHLDADFSFNIDRIEGDCVVVWIDNNSLAEPVCGASLWVEDGVIRWRLDEAEYDL